MYQNMSDDIFQKLLKDSKTYYGSKKSETKLKGDYQAFGGYSEDDQKLIKAGEEPKNGRQLWIKLFCDEKGTDGFGKALKNTAKDIYESNPSRVVSKDLNFSSVTFYIRWIWLGKKTTVTFMLANSEFEMD